MSSILRISLFLCLLAAPLSRADSLWIGSGGTGAIQIDNATITRVEKDKLFWSVNGRETSRELARIQRIVVDGEPALSSAEEAYIAGKMEPAVDGYQKTIRSTTKSWVKDWSAIRLIDAATKTGRFDAA